ncbi:DUF354 domain-containing protein [Methanosarcina mazei]|uniref:DUF354 domain-containing protein n=1 Tax=Methanosarcina mazei SarPi TaxID=1434115 RepID=A0A0E3RA92_METMZ|nr:DUF354 domain-containing protein [Methanosarcina mazei]AKB62440.1 hypothetical protein MSMAP_2455 [Methanosarcina mazei SarPi]
MRVMVWVGHPKHVHFWKNIVRGLISHGHEVKILAVEKDATIYLLNSFGLEYEILGKNYENLTKKIYGLIQNDIKAFKVAKKFKPDILVSGISLSHISKLIGKPCIFLSDTEHAHLANWLAFPFSDLICTPSCYKMEINPKKQIKYNSYEELAYLHPNYFRPDSTVLSDLGLRVDENFIVLRFVSWNASHDIGQKGIDTESKRECISKLEQYGRVFISSESKIENQFEKYSLNITPEKMHSLLSYAKLYLGESGAMSTEAALLGTPSIYVSSLAGKMGNMEELEEKYGLLHSFTDPKNAIECAINLLENKSVKKEWKNKKEKLLSEKIDITKFMIELIENKNKFRPNNL